MANVIRGTYEDAGAILGGALTLEDRNYFMGNAKMLASKAAAVGINMFESFVEKVHDINFGATYNRVESLASRAKGTERADVICYLDNPDKIRLAGQSMNRWVMAHRKTRSLYIQGRVKGFGDEYYDNNVGTVGTDQYDYRKATDGVMVKDGDKVVIRQYIDTTYTDDVELTTMNKIDIAKTWRILDRHYDQDEEDLYDITDEDMGLID